MGTIFVTLSNRGGVGKSTISGNLAIALSKLGKKTLVVEGDLGATSLHMVLGVNPALENFRDILDGKCHVDEAIVAGAYQNLAILPNKMKLKDLYEADLFKFIEVIKGLSEDYEIAIVDGPAGIGRNALVNMKLADELIIVTSPDPSSITAALKLKKVAEALDLDIRGLIINKVPTTIGKGILNQIAMYFDLPVLGMIRSDGKADECIRRKRPMLVEYPNSPFSKEIARIAENLVGKRADGLATFLKGGGMR